LQYTHVAADVREAEQSGALVQHLFQADVIEQLAAQRSIHGEASDTCEGHRGLDASPIEHSAHAGAATEMRGDHAPRLRRILRDLPAALERCRGLNPTAHWRSASLQRRLARWRGGNACPGPVSAPRNAMISRRRTDY